MTFWTCCPGCGCVIADPAVHATTCPMAAPAGMTALYGATRPAPTDPPAPDDDPEGT